MPPNTGNQASRPRYVPSNGDIEPWDLNQFAELIEGKFGMPVKLERFGSATEYNLRIQPQNAAKKALSITDSSGNPMFGVEGSEVYAVLLLRALGGLEVTGVETITLNNNAVWGLTVKNSSAGAWGIQILRADNSALLRVSDGLGMEIGVPINSAITINNTLNITGATTIDDTLHVTGTSDFDDDANFDGDVNIAGTLTGGGIGATTGTYTGAGTGGGGRDITLGYQPKMVIITGGNSTATIEEYTTLSTTYATRKVNSGNMEYTTGVHLLTTGFRVSDGVTHGDVSGRSYNYVAFK